MPDTVEVAALKKQRTALKTKFTKFTTYINDGNNKNKITEIRVRLQKIESVLEQFEEVQLSISNLNGESSAEFDTFENQYYKVVSKAHDLITPKQSLAVSTITNSDQPKSNIRLPKIDLATFNGAFEKWLDFRNSFKSIVDNDRGLSSIQKLHYLRSCLKDEALSVISALELTDQNYLVAWDLLEKRFDNKRVIIQNHVKAIMELSSISKESACDLRKLLDTIQTHLRALKSLGQSVDTWDTLLIYIITSKIDINTHREWEKSITGSEMPSMKMFIEFLEQRCQILQVTAINLNQHHTYNAYGSNKQQTYNKKQTFTSTKKSFTCIVCQDSHKLYTCDTFQKMSVRARYDKLKSAKICFNCLYPGHRTEECKWSKCCKICNSKHNTLLHIDNKDNSTNENQNNVSSVSPLNDTANIKVHSAIVSSQILLSTALVNIGGKNGEIFQARVLLDSGSQSHFITRKFADQLRIPLHNVNLPVEGLNRLETRVKHSINARIYSKFNNYQENVEFLVLPRICEHLPNQFINRHTLNLPKNIQLADPKFYEPNEIDALLGAELFYDLLCVGQIELSGHKARLYKTKLGWVVSGKIANDKKSVRPANCMLTLNSLQKTIENFWEIEEIENKTFLSNEEFPVEEHFKQKTKRDPETGRYIVRLPFNEKINKLGESDTMALKQFYSLEKRLAKNLELKMQYIDGMREAIKLGHMREIKLTEISGKHCFLPHHPVIKESSSTTKVRIVLNAITKTVDKISLWSDSSITLQWINTQPYLLKTFVANRVSEIRDISKTMHWRHVPSEDNMADALSRGQLPDEFVNNKTWRAGPKRLRHDESRWPNGTMVLVPLCELKSIYTLTTTQKSPNIILNNYLSIYKAKRIMSYALRFINNTSKTKIKLSRPLSVNALDNLTNNFLTQNGTSWHFIPPRSPHFGGLWEAAVRSFKHHYVRIIGDKLFTFEELETYATEIKAILNSRPITPLSDDPNDLRALTPTHFLIGDTFTSLPDADLTGELVNRLSTWQHVQYIKQHFLKRWYKKYLNQLNTRSKWQTPTSNNIQIGTMVLLKEDNTPHLHWQLGRIIEVFPGEDNQVQVVKVKTHSGVYKRSITRVAPLPIDNTNTNKHLLLIACNQWRAACYVVLTTPSQSFIYCYFCYYF